MEKDRLRARMVGLPPPTGETQARVREALLGWLSPRLPGTITAYLAIPGEIDLEPLFDRLPGWRWVLPRVEPGSKDLVWRDRDTPRERHPYGMEQPVAGEPVIPVAEIDVFLVPGVAFDPSGGRLGRGGGFYDRALVLRRGDSQAVGVTVEARVIEAVPMGPTDMAVDWVATECGVTRCPPTR